MLREHPIPTVDAIILFYEKKEFQGIVLVKRKFEPKEWAFPGGLVEYGESLEECVEREAKEETGISIKIVKQLHTYSNPNRDKRFHSISTVFLAEGSGRIKASDDAEEVKVFSLKNVPRKLCFDHGRMLKDSMKEIKKRV